ncbi:MAG: S-methyl-5-thioribose-1-phosphate isomerase [Burkholderiaceae bacterium]
MTAARSDRRIGDEGRTLWRDRDGRLRTLDQTRLPFEITEIELATAADCAHAIRTMQVRGAPLIGAVGAWGLALALAEDPTDASLARASDDLLATRPTAVNLRWALERVRAQVAMVPAAERAAMAAAVAAEICDEDVDANRRIGLHAIGLLMASSERAPTPTAPLQVLTHCNAGRIATLDYGTALAPIYLMQERGLPVHVWVDETRPRNQGASLTAWELGERGVAHTVIADNAGGLLMQRGGIDVVIVGADRVAANGDVVNKIGTYLKALAARASGVPFYVACPVSTIDSRARDGASIEIEFRSEREVTHMRGVDPDGRVVEVRIAPDTTPALNPAFDVTPASLVTGIVTEFGLVEATPAGIAHALSQSQGDAGPGPERP